MTQINKNILQYIVLYFLFVGFVSIPFPTNAEEGIPQILERSFNDKLTDDLQGTSDPTSSTVTAELNDNELLWVGDKALVSSTFRFELLFSSKHKDQLSLPDFSLLVDHTARGIVITSAELFRDTRYSSGAQFLSKDEASVITIPLSFGRTLVVTSFVPSFNSSAQSKELTRKSLICFFQAVLPKNKKNINLADAVAAGFLPRVHSARVLARGDGSGEIGASIASGLVKVFFEPSSKVLPAITPSEVVSRGKSPRVKYSYQPGKSPLSPFVVTGEELTAELNSNVFLQSGAGNTRLLYRNHSARLASFLPSSLLISKIHKSGNQVAHECLGIIERVKSQIVYGRIE